MDRGRNLIVQYIVLRINLPCLRDDAFPLLLKQKNSLIRLFFVFFNSDTRFPALHASISGQITFPLAVQAPTAREEHLTDKAKRACSAFSYIQLQRLAPRG